MILQPINVKERASGKHDEVITHDGGTWRRQGEGRGGDGTLSQAGDEPPWMWSCDHAKDDGMDTTETLRLTDAGCDQGGDGFPLLVEGLTSAGADGRRECNHLLGQRRAAGEKPWLLLSSQRYCRVSFFKSSDEGAKSNIFQTFKSSF